MLQKVLIQELQERNYAKQEETRTEDSAIAKHAIAKGEVTTSAFAVYSEEVQELLGSQEKGDGHFSHLYPNLPLPPAPALTPAHNQQVTGSPTILVSRYLDEDGEFIASAGEGEGRRPGNALEEEHPGNSFGT